MKSLIGVRSMRNYCWCGIPFSIKRYIIPTTSARKILESGEYPPELAGELQKNC